MMNRNNKGAFYSAQDLSYGSNIFFTQGKYSNALYSSEYLNALCFDASLSNSLYSNNISTVQPPAYKIYAWKRIS